MDCVLIVKNIRPADLENEEIMILKCKIDVLSQTIVNVPISPFLKIEGLFDQELKGLHILDDLKYNVRLSFFRAFSISKDLFDMLCMENI